MPTATEVWLVSALPPPVHGVSAFNEALLERMRRDKVPHRVFRVGTRGDLANVERFQAQKLVRDALTLARLGGAGLRARRRGPRPTLYLTPAQGLMSNCGPTVLRDLAVARLGRGLGCRVVAHLHGCGYLNRGRHRLLGRVMLEVLRSCDQLICLGDRYARVVGEATGVPSVGIMNGVPEKEAPVPRRPPRRDEPIELLFLSNLMGEKGLFVAGQAVRELASLGLSPRLRCAGTWLRAAERAAFTSRFAPELAAGDIELVGFVGGAGKDELLRKAHFLLLPSLADDEGQPLALIEAMALGLPAITTPQGGIPDVIGPDLPGLCSASHRTANGLAQGVLALVEDPLAYSSISERCLARQRSALTTEACIPSVLQVLLS